VEWWEDKKTIPWEVYKAMIESQGRKAGNKSYDNDTDRVSSQRRAGEKIQWRDEAQKEAADTLDHYESDKRDEEMPKKPYGSARLERQRAVAKVIAESRLRRRIDEHRKRLQEREMQQRQERKHRSSERVDWYTKMMRDRNAKSRETRERGGGARHPGLAEGIPQVKGK
jgi:hypothetical protein